MEFWNIAIPTAILWGLTAVVVTPLANYLFIHRLKAPEFAHLNITHPMNLIESGDVEIQSIYTHYFVITDIIVLGIAGFIGGILGYLLIGISLDAKGWPGMIAFIAGSILGLSLK